MDILSDVCFILFGAAIGWLVLVGFSVKPPRDSGMDEP